MSDDIPHLWSIRQLGEKYRQGETSPVEILGHIESRIDSLDTKLQAYITRTPEVARSQALRATEELKEGIDRGPLHGVPISLKDLIEVDGVLTTGGSRLLASNVSTRSAPLYESLDNAGAVLLGKNSTYEFGLGLPMSGDWPDPARNPWSLDRIPGGSSSGSAASVFAGLSFGSFGTDTGGSIRGPAAYCGVVGLKPTRGLVDIAGVLPLSGTLDHVGPLGRSVDDTRILLEAASSAALGTQEPTELSGHILGVPWDLIEAAEFGAGVEESFRDTVKLLESAGAQIESVELPATELVESVLKSIVGYESFAVHRDSLRSDPELYGPSGFERLSSGGSISAETYESALESRDEITAQVDRIFEKCPVLISPVTHTTAATFVDYEISPTPRTLFTGIFNLVGAPALSIPSGLDANEMPIGLQVACPSNSDRALLNVSESIESLIGFPPTLSSDARDLRQV